MKGVSGTMSFVSTTTRDASRVEDLFTHTPDDASFLIAVLSDDTRLFLSPGFTLRRNPWPLLKYEPYVLKDEGACTWLDTRRAKTLELRPDMRNAYEQSHPRGVGSQVPVRNLELGKHPVLEHEIVQGSSWHMDVLDEASYEFEGVIVEFIPVMSREGV